MGLLRGGGATGCYGAASRPEVSGVQVREADRRDGVVLGGFTESGVEGRVASTAGMRADRIERGRSIRGRHEQSQDGGGGHVQARGATARATPSSMTERSEAAGGSRPSQGQDDTASGATSHGGLTTPPVMDHSDRSEGEVSNADEPEAPASRPSREAMGQVPRQPGKSTSTVALSNALTDLIGVVSAGTGGTVRGATDQKLAADRPASSG